jgi:hypothetical protein
MLIRTSSKKNKTTATTRESLLAARGKTGKRVRVDRGEGNWEVDDQERAFGDGKPAKSALRLPEPPEGQYEGRKQDEKRREAPLETSWGADSEELPEDDPEIGGRDVNLEARGHVPLSPDEDPTKASLDVDVCEGSFGIFGPQFLKGAPGCTACSPVVPAKRFLQPPHLLFAHSSRHGLPRAQQLPSIPGSIRY